jgi:hypothetical protein
MSTKRRRESNKKRTVRRTTTGKKATTKKVTTGRKTKAAKKVATKTKRVSAAKPKGRQEPSRVRALMPRGEVAGLVLQEAHPMELVEVTSLEVIAIREPGTAG